jgi:hypothetical protein
MPCTPLTEPQFSPPSNPSIGGFAPSQGGLSLNIPFPPIKLPDLSVLDALLSLRLPSGKMKVNWEPDFLNDIYGAINDLLAKFTPFLMLYKFFLPVLNLILCIIEVLCALLSPFKLPGAIITLFTQCIPDFLALFPFFAIIIMIISLLLLILALIEYLIARIIIIIEIIIANIVFLGRCVARLEEDSIIAIIQKVGDILCLLSNLFIILGFITAIIQIIKALLTLSFNIPPCSSSNGSSTGCCTPDVCPDFIKNNSTITGSTGDFLYLNAVGVNTVPESFITMFPDFPAIVNDIRDESWQFYDPNLDIRQAFINITQAYDLPPGITQVFFPSGVTYTETSSSSSAPYTITFTFFYNPVLFPITGYTDTKGPRYVQAVNVIVQNPPTAGVLNWDNELVAPFNGTLNLVGGAMYEADGSTPILNNQNMQMSLNTFIHEAATVGSTLTNDGYLFSDLTYSFNINHEALLGFSLITLGCIPEVATNRDFINSTIGAQFNINGANLAAITLPDTAATQACLTNAITQFTQNISVASATEFQANMNACLGTLQDQTTSALTAAITAGYDQYKSTFTLTPTVQFTTHSIEVSVILNENSGQPMATNLPATVGAQLAANLSTVLTLGNISQFVYDGYGAFNANITSDIPGNGTIEVAFNNSFISTLNIPTDITLTPSTSITQASYTFVSSPALAGTTGGQPRRDEGDIARDGE